MSHPVRHLSPRVVHHATPQAGHSLAHGTNHHGSHLGSHARHPPPPPAIHPPCRCFDMCDKTSMAEFVSLLPQFVVKKTSPWFACACHRRPGRSARPQPALTAPPTDRGQT